MHRMFVRLASLVLACGIGFAAIPTQRATPPNAELERFPIMGRKPAVAELGRMGLKPITLDRAWTGFNWHRDKGRFVLDTLQPGTVVWADASGAYRYRDDCWNRLVSLQQCASGGSTRTPPPVSSTPPGGGNGRSGGSVGSASGQGGDSQRKSIFGGFADSMWNGAKSIWPNTADLAKGYAGILASLVGIALLLALLAVPFLLWYLIYRAYQNRQGGGQAQGVPQQGAGAAAPAVIPQQRQAHAAAAAGGPPVAPAIPAAPPVVPAAPQAQGRRFVNFAPADANNPNMVRFGGFNNVRVEEDQGVTTIRFA